MPRNAKPHVFESDLSFYRAGFPLPSLDRIRPVPNAGRAASDPLHGRILRAFTVTAFHGK